MAVAMEFIIVKYPSSRTVYIDGTRAGFTNEIMVLETGNHEFDLGKPEIYAPQRIDREVKDTAVTDPMVLVFEKKQT